MGKLTGQNVAPSQVTRWEKGTTPPSVEVLTWYEELLGLPPHSLAVVVDGMARFANSAGPRHGRRFESEDARLHELLDRATVTGAMCSSSWLELTAAVRRRPQLVLHPPQLWDSIAENLLSELLIAVDTAWLARQESLSRLIEHRSAAAHVVATCVAVVRDDAAPVYLEAASLLDVSSTVDANRFVLTQVTRPDNVNMLEGALLAAVSKAKRGHFREADKTAMLRAVVELLDDTTIDPALALPAAELAGQLWDRRASRSVRPFPGSGTQVWLPDRRTGPVDADLLCVQIALCAQAGLDVDLPGVDQLLASLVQAMLFSANLDNRLYSGMLLAATPYRQPLIDTLVQQLSAGLLRRHESVLLSVFQALNTLNSTQHHEIVCRLLLDDSTGMRLRQAAARSMPYHAGHIPTALWARILRCQSDRYVRCPDPEQAAVLHSVAYGIATGGHHHLARAIRDDPRLPAAARGIARWWINIPATVQAAART